MICPLSPTRVYDDKGDERNDRSNTKKDFASEALRGGGRLAYYAAQRQAGNVSTARRGCGESAGAADDHAAKEYGAT